MKKLLPLFIFLFSSIAPLAAWWDPGHLVTAMIAYENLSPEAKKRVDELAKTLQRDYPYVNHFIATGPWPDDLKAEGVRTYDTWHYTNIPLNPNRLPLADQPVVDVVWAINQMKKVLEGNKPRDIDKARHLAFLVHFVGDLHQPLHSTSVHSNEIPGGNIGGNAFELKGRWHNLHSLWDDGCGFLTSFNNINPYGIKKIALLGEEIFRVKELANQLMEEYPKEYFDCTDQSDPDFWALESHKIAVKHGYRGANKIEDNGYRKWIKPGDEPSELYLENGQKIVKERLTLAGYRLANILNEVFEEDEFQKD